MKKLLDCKSRSWIDLHIHSNFSDGNFSPTEILTKASILGLKAVSITDHDTLEGAKVALQAVEKYDNLSFLSGVELSVNLSSEFDIVQNIHILGYGVKVDDHNFCSYLSLLKRYRLDRAKEILNRLSEIGIFISEKEVLGSTMNEIIGRPHIAKIMIKKGFVTSFNDAFDRFLGYNKPAYVGKQKTDIEEVFCLIKNAGGVPVLAHPSLIGIKDSNIFEKFIVKLKSIGLVGIEALYPEHSVACTDFYCKVAVDHGLLVTGGTDFHGESTPGLSIGFGSGDFSVPFCIYKKLFKALKI